MRKRKKRGFGRGDCYVSGFHCLEHVHLKLQHDRLRNSVNLFGAIEDNRLEGSKTSTLYSKLRCRCK